jgi:hypothetical protein
MTVQFFKMNSQKINHSRFHVTMDISIPVGREHPVGTLNSGLALWQYSAVRIRTRKILNEHWSKAKAHSHANL